MPIERRSLDRQIRAALIGVVALVFAVTLGYALIRATVGSRSSVATEPGGRTFVVGRASSLAGEAEDDGPILLPDASSGGQERPVFVWHRPSAEDDTGWIAYEAVPPDAPDDCFLAWDRERRVLSAPCAAGEYGPDGEGLTPVPVEVDDDGRVVIDLAPTNDDGQG